MRARGRRGAALVALGVALAVLATACSRREGRESEAGQRSLPRSLSRAESAAEDTIDLILAGQRDKAIKSSRTLDKLAHGDLAADLEGIATKQELDQLQARAAELAKVAPTGEPITVALTANHAFEVISQLSGKFPSEVPAAVMKLDYLDFEAKLRAMAHEIDRVRISVSGLSTTWSELVKAFPSGEKAAEARSSFETHVAAMATLAAAGTDFDGLAKEAQHGLDLVDELEAVYGG